jgi:hypothetical protein
VRPTQNKGRVLSEIYSLPVALEYDISSLQNSLKEAKKVVVRQPEPSPTVVTQTRLTQTDPWAPPPASSNNKSDAARKEVLVMKKPTVVTLEPEDQSRATIERLEYKYEAIIREKDEQIQELLQEVCEAFRFREKTSGNGYF